MIYGYQFTAETLIGILGLVVLAGTAFLIVYKIKGGISKEAEEKAKLKQIEENDKKIKALKKELWELKTKVYGIEREIELFQKMNRTIFEPYIKPIKKSESED